MNFLNKKISFYFLLFFCIVVIFLLSLYNLSINNKIYVSGSKQEPTGYIHKINEGTEIVQEFEAKNDNLKKITIYFEPLKDEHRVGGNVVIQIKDDNGEVLKSDVISRNYIRSSGYYSISFKKQTNSKGRKYKIEIKFDDILDYDKFYSVLITDKNSIETNHLSINGVMSENSSLIFNDFYVSNTRLFLFCSFIIAGIFITVISCFVIYNKKSIKIEKLYLFVMAIVCLSFLITMPTFKNHDEYYHWLKAYEVSNGHLKTPIVDGIQGSQMPSVVSEIFPTSTWTKMSYSDVRKNLSIKVNYDEHGLLNPETAAVYSFVQYIPQSTGIALSRLFTDRVYLFTYAGRIFNLVVSVLLCYLAIKIIPFGKGVLFVLSAIPTTVEAFTSLSPDALTISLSFLYLAYILRLTFDKKRIYKIKDFILLLIMSVMLALCKIVYLPLVGLILLIPSEKFKDKKAKYKILNFLIIFIISTIANLTWLSCASKYLSDFRDGDSAIQVLLAIKNPIHFIQMILYSMNIYGSKYVLSLFGYDVGWGELVKLYCAVPYTFILLSFFALFGDKTLKNKFSFFQYAVCFLVSAAIIGLIFASLYVQWTTVGSTSILGVQGRYFLPILPIMMFIIGSAVKIQVSYKEESILKFISIVILLVNLYVSCQILVSHL